MKAFFERMWYGEHPLTSLLKPLSWGFQKISSIRRWYQQQSQQQFSVPIIVVGNLSVGGVGKTPLVIALAQAFLQKGVRVGVVSRGYGATIKTFPHELSLDDTPLQVGDEPLLIARKCACPVVIAPRRTDAVEYLIHKHQSQVIISDDGLQHYRMGRALEIVVIDGLRLFGNGYCLPAGPLREDLSRLQEVDFLVVNGADVPAQAGTQYKHAPYIMNLKPKPLKCLVGTSLKSPPAEPVAAVAGIGNPQRFFDTLATLGIDYQPYAFPDHHQFTATDFKFQEKSVVMTEKDAVKCEAFAGNNWYVLPVEAELSDAFWQAFWSHEQITRVFK